MLSRAGVINTDLLAGSQRSRHSFARCIDDVRCRAQSETYRALRASDDDRFAGLICGYRPGLVSRACGGFCCRCRSVRCRCFFGRGRTGLRKRKRRSQPADQSNNCLLHSVLLLDLLTPQFVTPGWNGRFMSVLCCDGSGGRAIRTGFGIVQFEASREFCNIDRR
jgi:hypothetical protein